MAAIEIWRPLAKYGNTYAVSSMGRVKNLLTGNLVKTHTNDTGYVYAHIHYKGRWYTLRVHRLVATAFIPNPYNKKEVNHIDGNKTNNCISNLEWCTRMENQSHAIRMHKRNKQHKENSLYYGDLFAKVHDR